MLYEKIEEIQTEVIVQKYGLPSRNCLTDLVKIHKLEYEEAKLKHNIQKLFPDNGALQSSSGLFGGDVSTP